MVKQIVRHCVKNQIERVLSDGSMSMFMAISFLFLSGLQAYALPNTDVSHSDSDQDHSITEEKVMQALRISRNKAPMIQEDALKVWGKFKSDQIEPSPTYYFWGQNLIISLRNDDKIKFESQGDVEKVFSILLDKKIITADAANVLARFTWENLHHLSELPLNERVMPQNLEERERIYTQNLNEVKQ